MAAPNEPEPVESSRYYAVSPIIPDPVHYAAQDLDVYPQALQQIAPVYPERAPDPELVGFVTLWVLIDESGRVVGRSVADSSPDGVFEQAARQALAGAMFSPARKDGRAVRSRLLIRVKFNPELASAAQ